MSTSEPGPQALRPGAARRTALALALLAPLAAGAAQAPRLGAPLDEGRLEGFDLIVTPDGDGLPAGSGAAREGRAVYDARCASCHGLDGSGTIRNTALAGGDMDSEDEPLRTVGSYWPWASTVFDFVRRAMPADAPKSLSDREVWQVTAYVLYLNGLVGLDQRLDRESLPRVRMPNADGFVDRSAAR